MKNFSTWLIVIFMVMFWLFRAIVALCTQYSIDIIGIESYNLNYEIIISFITIICIVLVAKRNTIGSLIYFFIYGAYFGQHFISNIIPLLNENATLTSNLSVNLIVDAIAILLAIFSVGDMLLDKERKINPSDPKNDWYFKNEKYDKELEQRDKREDKNEYKFF